MDLYSYHMMGVCSLVWIKIPWFLLYNLYTYLDFSNGFSGDLRSPYFGVRSLSVIEPSEILQLVI